MPLVKGDGISRADSLQLGPVPALGRDTWSSHQEGPLEAFPAACFWEVLPVSHLVPTAEP